VTVGGSITSESATIRQEPEFVTGNAPQ
jgi:hypothetical protein